MATVEACGDHVHQYSTDWINQVILAVREGDVLIITNIRQRGVMSMLLNQIPYSHVKSVSDHTITMANGKHITIGMEGNEDAYRGWRVRHLFMLGGLHA